MSKMGSHDTFKFLKHKLWPKEGPEVKLPIWLSTTKNHELPQFTYLKVACHILLNRSWGELQLWFKPHLNPISTHNPFPLHHWHGLIHFFPLKSKCSALFKISLAMLPKTHNWHVKRYCNDFTFRFPQFLTIKAWNFKILTFWVINFSKNQQFKKYSN
jgi:hypothetical protein